MRIAVWQGQAAVLDLDANLAAIDEAARQAAAKGADLVLTPELFVTGYAPQRVSSVTAEQLADAQTRLSQIAGKHRIALVASLPGGDCSGRRHISAHLYGADGALLLTHHKVHLFGADEKSAFQPASNAPGVVTMGDLKVSLLICYDVEFPESARAATAAGADIIVAPTALTPGYDTVAQVLIPARALENHVAVAYGNHTGVEDGLPLAGGSVIAGPTGTILAQAGQTPELIVADITRDEIDAARADVSYWQDRRPGLYRTWEAQ